MENRIGIIGAGLVGSLHAMYLAQKGLRISVFERRPDVRNVELVGGRSINLALSDRGWKALEGVGLDAEVRKMAIPMYGRVMHAVDGTLTYQPYGKEGQAIYSVSRGGLNQLMLRKVDELDNAALYFDRKCRDIDVRSGEVTFEHTVSGEREQHTFDRIFGTDGAFSAVRSRLQRRDRFNYSQTYLTHGYKELEIPPNADGSHKLEVNALLSPEALQLRFALHCIGAHAEAGLQQVERVLVGGTSLGGGVARLLAHGLIAGSGDYQSSTAFVVDAGLVGGGGAAPVSASLVSSSGLTQILLATPERPEGLSCLAIPLTPSPRLLTAVPS